IEDCKSEVVVTADGGYRASRLVPLKQTTDDAIAGNPSVKRVIVLKRTGKDIPWTEGRDHWWHDEMKTASTECPAEPMDAEDPLFILYTSGSTGKPKGVMHTTGGYLVYTSLTHELIFDIREDDTYWCTADCGWGRFWDVVDKYGVTILYTAPTAIRAIAREGDEPVKKRSRKSLRLLGTVGEPINPEVWLWYHRVVGDGRCPIVDTWWQTETGG